MPHRMTSGLVAALVGALTPSLAAAIPPPPDVEPAPEGGEAAAPVADDGFRLSVPTTRLLLGASWLETEDTFKAGFALDVGLGLIFAARRHGTALLLWPELTYSYGAIDGLASHLVTAGLGVHVGDEEASFGWTPRFVAGGLGGETVIGVRNSLIGRWMLFSAEVSHTWMDGPEIDPHEVRFVVGIDVLWLIVGVLFWNSFSTN